MNRLGILGGSFNPPHVAHLIAGEIAVEEYQLDRLLFIPANIPPHKAGLELASAEDRLAMTRIATEGNPRFHVSDMEIRRAGKSYTIDTLDEVKEQYKPQSLYLFIGLDMLAIFDSWHKADEILCEATVVAMTRPGYDLTSVAPQLRAKIEFLPIPQLEISSTEIRTRVLAGKSIHYFLPEAVGAYIADHQLYK